MQSSLINQILSKTRWGAEQPHLDGQKFSNMTDSMIRLKIHDIPAVPHSIYAMQDLLDDASKEINDAIYEAGVHRAAVQRKMRSIQKRFIEQPGVKITQAERQYKADPEHSEMESLSEELDAFIDYAKTCRTIVANKYYALSRKHREGEE